MYGSLFVWVKSFFLSFALLRNWRKHFYQWAHICHNSSLLFDLKEGVFILGFGLATSFTFFSFVLQGRVISSSMKSLRFCSLFVDKVYVHYISSYGDEFLENCFFFLFVFNVPRLYLRMHLLHHAWWWFFRGHCALGWCLKFFQILKELVLTKFRI